MERGGRVAAKYAVGCRAGVFALAGGTGRCAAKRLLHSTVLPPVPWPGPGRPRRQVEGRWVPAGAGAPRVRRRAAPAGPRARGTAHAPPGRSGGRPPPPRTTGGRPAGRGGRGGGAAGRG